MTKVAPCESPDNTGDGSSSFGVLWTGMNRPYLQFHKLCRKAITGTRYSFIFLPMKAQLLGAVQG
jgi:hypothetical protein